VSQRDTVYQPRASLWVHAIRPPPPPQPPWALQPPRPATVHLRPVSQRDTAYQPRATLWDSSGSSTTTTTLGPPTASLCHRSPPPRVPTGHRIPAQSNALGSPPPHHPRSVGTPYTSPEHRSGIAAYQPRTTLRAHPIRPPPPPHPTRPTLTKPPVSHEPSHHPTRQSGKSGQYRHPFKTPARNSHAPLRQRRNP